MSEYHKIETLYERDEKSFRIKPELILKNRVYGLLKSWRWTEKIDGTNIRVIWIPAYAAIGEPEKAITFAGKTDNAQLHSELVNWLRANVTVDKLQAVFPDTGGVLYGEGYGAGIQKGGGLYSPTKKFILFDVRVGEWWLSQENVNDVAAKLGIDVVPDFGDMTLEDATALVRRGFPSRIGSGPSEGLVGRPVEALFDKKGHRLIVKLKTKDF